MTEHPLNQGMGLNRPGNLDEAGLSRVVSHSKKRPFAVITAFRDRFNLKTNRSRNRNLLSVLQRDKMAPILLNGHWAEAPEGVAYADAKPEDLVDVREESFFVPMPDEMEFPAFEKAMTTAMNGFQQDAVVLGTPGDGAWLKFRGGSVEKLGNLTVGKIAQAYSEMRNNSKTTFVFEGTSRPSGMASSMGFRSLGLSWYGKGGRL